MTTPAISLIVLAWNQRLLTERCVASLRAHTDVPYELIIVDNGSSADAATFARDVADVAVLNETNLGFAAGMNRGLASASGTYVAFINNDTEFPPGWASGILETFADHPTAGLVLPAVTAAGNPFAVRSAAGTEQIVVQPFRDIPSGVVYVLPRSLALAIGGWSEEYPVASSEDLDLLFTVWSVGREVVLDERVLVEHVGSATVREQLPEWWKLWRENRRIFTKKWMHVDPAVFPVPDGSDAARVRQRLEMAATAATWMDRVFDARDEKDALRRQLAGLQKSARTPAPAPRRRRGWRRLLASIRRS